jgi:hypothetical protein
MGGERKQRHILLLKLYPHFDLLTSYDKTANRVSGPSYSDVGCGEDMAVHSETRTRAQPRLHSKDWIKLATSCQYMIKINPLKPQYNSLEKILKWNTNISTTREAVEFGSRGENGGTLKGAAKIMSKAENLL